MTFFIMVVSVWVWQAEVLPFQLGLQVVSSLLLVYVGYVKVTTYKNSLSPPITFTEQGHWIELIGEAELGKTTQSSWYISHQSRITGLFLLVHVFSVLNPSRSKWITIYKDQVSELNYRRLCRAVIFQQQKLGR